jgi:hypothetical protein
MKENSDIFLFFPPIRLPVPGDSYGAAAYPLTSAFWNLNAAVIGLNEMMVHD